MPSVDTMEGLVNTALELRTTRIERSFATGRPFAKHVNGRGTVYRAAGMYTAPGTFWPVIAVRPDC